MHGLHQVRARDPSDPIIPKGSAAPKEGAIRAWAYALALIVFGLPIFSPDLFWHLSVARWIQAHAAIPRQEDFSFTLGGAPWIDFEWMTQILWYGTERLGGMWGLWVLKILLLLAAFLPVDGLLRRREAAPAARAGASALWLAAMLPRADLRADLISAFFFACLLKRLEAGRASFLFGFGLFALWANLHGGFLLGFFLYALYALSPFLGGERRPEGLSGEAVGAVLGSFLNPYGFRLYGAILAHADPVTTRLIAEWGPLNWHHAFQVPLMGALAVTAAVLWIGRKTAPRTLAVAATGLCLATALSARFGAYFASAAAMAVFTTFPRPRLSFMVGGLAALSLALVPVLSSARLGTAFQDAYVARRAVEFIAREGDIFRSLRLFNQYEWGGYLGWRMGESYKIFGDGRYLFCSQLPEIQKALDSSDGILEMAQRRHLDGFLIKNERLLLSSTRVYPDGTRREIPRPWHVFIFPRERWALAYWDDQALLFLDRAKIPTGWLAAHEYRWLRPGDERALQDALSRGEVPPPALEDERARHASEIKPSGFAGF